MLAAALVCATSSESTTNCVTTPKPAGGGDGGSNNKLNDQVMVHGQVMKKDDGDNSENDGIRRRVAMEVKMLIAVPI